MQIIPDGFLQIIQKDKNLHKAILDIDSKIEDIIKGQNPVFFPEYTDHGIDHFANTLKMAYHLIDLDESEKAKGNKPVIDQFSSLNSVILAASILLHDLGMHIHYKGFCQLITGFFDDVRVDFFDELTWRQEWENFMIEAKRFSGRERINLFGDEQALIKDIDFSKPFVDSDTQKRLIGEFIRRHHGRLAHEIILKGFPVENHQIISLAPDMKDEYKDIIGLIARSHSMNVRDAMTYIEDKFPADSISPYEIEVAFIMCILRVSDYFQFDSSRSNAFLIKIRSFASPFSLREHQTHLATEYFRTHENDPETLFVDLKPKDGLLYTKLIRLFDDIQRELDISFAIIGELYGRQKKYLRLRYRRIKTNLKNKKVVSKLSYVAEIFRFEADADLFKLLVGPLYGYEPSYGVRELLQNSIDACMEFEYKNDDNYISSIEITISKIKDDHFFIISDNGKGMSIGEIKNYFLKAGASFRNSTEWKVDYQTEENTSAIRRTGKFGIGILASFLIGKEIEVTTKRYNETIGYDFTANLSNEFIEVKKNYDCDIGTIIKIKIDERTFELFKKQPEKITEWYFFSSPKVKYVIDNKEIRSKNHDLIETHKDVQILKDSIELKVNGLESVIWKYLNEKSRYGGYQLSETALAINGIKIPQKSYWGETTPLGQNKYDLERFPFVSIIDKNNILDLELNRNSLRDHLPFLEELIESCRLDFIYKFLFFDNHINGDELLVNNHRKKYLANYYCQSLNTSQFLSVEIVNLKSGYTLNSPFFSSILKSIRRIESSNQLINLVLN